MHYRHYCHILVTAVAVAQLMMSGCSLSPDTTWGEGRDNQGFAGQNLPCTTSFDCALDLECHTINRSTGERKCVAAQ